MGKSGNKGCTFNFYESYETNVIKSWSILNEPVLVFVLY